MDWTAGEAAAMSCGAGTTAVNSALLRTRVHSVLVKKNSLFFLTGPPIEKPNWLRTKTGLVIPYALSLKLLEAKSETRLNSYAVPWNWLVPDLVVTLITPASARPYSAVKLLVMMPTSWTESSGVVWPTDAMNSLLFATPSSRMLVPDERRPLIDTPAPRPVPAPPVGSSSLTFPDVTTSK